MKMVMKICAEWFEIMGTSKSRFISLSVYMIDITSFHLGKQNRTLITLTCLLFQYMSIFLAV